MRHLVIAFVMLLSMQCLADDVPKSRSTLFAQNVGIVLSDAGMFFTTPLRFSPGESIAVGGFVGGTILVIAQIKGLYDGITAMAGIRCCEPKRSRRNERWAQVEKDPPCNQRVQGL